MKNYSPAIQLFLKKNGIGLYDSVTLSDGKSEIHGIVMPRSGVGDSGNLVIKRSDGYNVGIRFTKNTVIELIKKNSEFKKVPQSIKFSSKMPPISLISIGGTIASRIDYRTGGVTGLMTAQEIIANIPELSSFANIASIASPFTNMSENFDPQDWISLAKAVHKELSGPSKGVVITQGTDTMHFTSAALSFMLPNLNKPVVITGSQKSRDRGSSDAGMNVICSAHIALSDMAHVGTCMHATLSDDYCFFLRGTKVRKMDTVRRDAFRPINDIPLAKVWPEGKIEKLQQTNSRHDTEPQLDAKFEHKTAIIRVFPGADPSVIDFYIQKGYKGFVIEASALGHVPTMLARKPWTPVIKRHTKDGIPFVITTQCVYGATHPHVYSNLRELFHDAGAINVHDMLTETAYVKLGWILAHTTDFAKVKELMQKNIAGEISDRLSPETFLY